MAGSLPSPMAKERSYKHLCPLHLRGFRCQPTVKRSCTCALVVVSFTRRFTWLPSLWLNFWGAANSPRAPPGGSAPWFVGGLPPLQTRCTLLSVCSCNNVLAVLTATAILPKCFKVIRPVSGSAAHSSGTEYPQTYQTLGGGTGQRHDQQLGCHYQGSMPAPFGHSRRFMSQGMINFSLGMLCAGMPKPNATTLQRLVQSSMRAQARA